MTCEKRQKKKKKKNGNLEDLQMSMSQNHAYHIKMQ